VAEVAVDRGGVDEEGEALPAKDAVLAGDDALETRADHDGRLEQRTQTQTQTERKSSTTTPTITIR
jgi:hypothetical protein